jgi:hypothetical protein
MIDYETFCKIRAYREQGGLKVAQIARVSFLSVIREPPATSWWIVSPVILFLGAEERTARRGEFLRGATAIRESGT